MKPNYLIFQISEFKDYIELYKNQGDTINWADILQLGERYPITIINVVDDSDNTILLAYAEWSWENKDKELKLHKIEVKETSLQKHGIGTTMMKMVIAIAIYYCAPRITGTVTGDEFLWHWYPRLGFTIIDNNKLLMEFSHNCNYNKI